MERSKFLAFYKNSTDAQLCYDAVSSALKELGIFTPRTLVGALATTRVEVGRNFRPIREIASGQAYEGRRDLGNTQKGDGVKYKGRGFVQITGRANYERYGKMLGLDLINNPDLALMPVNAARILALYFKDRKVNVACDRADWVRVRRLVNGGNGIEFKKGGTTHGLDDFLSIVRQFLA
jgi:hypothetical protein